MQPTPPKGYKLVKGHQINGDIPNHALVFSDDGVWNDSSYVGEEVPLSDFGTYYAIPDGSFKPLQEKKKTYTLKELADIGLNAACQFEPNSQFPLSFQNYREAFTKAILEAIGYELPKDEEREAFAQWWETSKLYTFCNADDAFKAWKAGREELRKELSPVYFYKKGGAIKGITFGQVDKTQQAE